MDHSKWICTLCYQIYTRGGSLESFITHYNNDHFGYPLPTNCPMNVHQCPTCNQITKTKRGLSRHRNAKHASSTTTQKNLYKPLINQTIGAQVPRMAQIRKNCRRNSPNSIQPTQPNAKSTNQSIELSTQINLTRKTLSKSNHNLPSDIKIINLSR